MPLLQGVYAAAVTPRRLGMQDINLGVMWDLIDFLCERRIQGLSLLGSTGEFIHYSNSERMRMMGLAPKRSRVPVLINVSHSNLDGSLELAQAAAASGAAGVLLMPPVFFRYTDDDVRLARRSVFGCGWGWSWAFEVQASTRWRRQAQALQLIGGTQMRWLSCLGLWEAKCLPEWL